MKKLITIGILLLFLMPTMSVISTNRDLLDNRMSYIPHEPIYINGNKDFTESNGVTSGEGTKNDPYIIKGWEINCTSQDGIVIRNVSKYFVIRDCYVHSGRENHDGIAFYNVQFGKIENNTISDNKRGINFADQYPGKENSEDNIITNNKITFNLWAGISFEHIGIGWHSRNEISNNDISYNGWGIYMIMSDSNEIIYNNFISNEACGVFIDQCRGGGQYNIVHHNNFVDNGKVIQAYDLGIINYWNDSYPSGGNYWSDYNGSDIYSGKTQSLIGADGIGDTPYEIRNSSIHSWLPIRYDCYPLMEPVGNINLPPARPVINGAKIGKETSIIQFNISSIDPNEDNVYLGVNWGDGSVDEWLGPYNSGQIITLNHSWNNQGNYEIIVKVTDQPFEEREWGIGWNNHTILIFPKSAIAKPVSGLYISNIKIFDLPNSDPIIIGNLDIKVDVLTQDLKIEKVQYYLNDVLKYTDYSEPFIWNWTEIGFSKFNVKTILYTYTGFNVSYQINVWKLF
ncbi:MAG: right-handed parallel beta-helix repeat-containing protein [Candidatus Thermoplasmatota archaeon]|nr:right-handed parallel beta-helix repeat-containing protein [Candidatus Thermoplasmatota archaeon]